MIRVSQVPLSLNGDEETLKKKTAKQLGIGTEDIKELVIVRQSIDARKKNRVQYIYSVDILVENEEHIVKRCSSPHIQLRALRKPYYLPELNKKSETAVVVGMGPAGLISALYLARAGCQVTLFERGKDVDARALDVEKFWDTGVLSTASNVQFGEGGAGTFSDGKLTTNINDSRVRTILKTFVAHGAPEDILYSSKPHVGTDILRKVVKSIRKELISLGVDIRFEHCVKDFLLEAEKVKAVKVQTLKDEYIFDCDTIVLAIGHSARDTFRMLDEKKIPMQQKPFGIGVRIEHKQEMISEAQFGQAFLKLPPSDYKLACHLPNGRSVYTFCVCPGGQVVASSSDEESVVTNGMSYRARDGKNINGAFLVEIYPEDFEGEDALAGMRFQEKWEQKAFDIGGGNYFAPAQLVGDFLDDRESTKLGVVTPTYKPGVKLSQLSDCLPSYVIEAMKDALKIFDRKIEGFAKEDSVLTGVETRSSSPLRIVRDRTTLSSVVGGLYPCGEGAGYAGGIVSAAVDGLRIAEAIINNKNEN